VADAMSRAFVKEDDADPGVVALPDRPISPHRNLVMRRGLRLIESKVAQYENDLARATAAADREAVGRAARELRYWTARLTSAEVAEPEPKAAQVVFGMAVTVLRGDETEVTFRIVGEDETDPSSGRIAWTAPVAQALLGSRPGDVRQLPTGEVEVLSISGTPEAPE
jgi:transcription elongation GreA/GreB family factor